jgi:IK cytokine
LHVLRGEELQAEERRKKEIEDSKYLGGDIKHTHLVKGLDFALLQRTRDEVGPAGSAMDTSDDTPAEEELAAPTEDTEMTVRVNASLSLNAPVFKTYSAFCFLSKDAKPKFQTRIARSVYETLFDPPVVHTQEFYAPGSMDGGRMRPGSGSLHLSMLGAASHSLPPRASYRSHGIHRAARPLL